MARHGTRLESLHMLHPQDHSPHSKKFSSCLTMTMSRGVSDHQKDAGSRRVELGSMEGDEPFPWLSADDRGAEYVSYSEFTDLPACSFDFGDQGYAASSNNGGNLLQMTARSDKHGIVFARGDFEYSLYLSLARGQRISGGKSAFGLQVAEPERSASSCEEVSNPHFESKVCPMFLTYLTQASVPLRPC
ncbi:hypothetical protein N657DRAFT_98288 [Parathielavia appendiculata]|uniref:Uncharacterized protein n=1 Tax=Parathielavia appendiculata TaxID=2587402 RepID=A0AAN6TWI2_9PEZI|nr:hypothetical protein N657DRAFT_98288 [Parathielavia appendiculata]